MRVLVTGVSGFVGGAIARHLVRTGHEVAGLSRRKANVPGLYGPLGNIGDSEAAARVVANVDCCDAIVHAAALIGGAADEAPLVLTNGLGTQQMLGVAAQWGVEQFVYLSSMLVIGRPRRLPILEDHPVAPTSAYHASKLYGEHLVAAAVVAGRPGVSLRLSSPVGAGMPDGRIVSVFVRRALAGEPLAVAGAGTRAQDYVDVRDVATAVSTTLERPVKGVFNLGSGRSVENGDLARRCVQALESNSEVRIGDRDDPQDGVRWELSIERARRELEWEPEHDLDATLHAVAGTVVRADSMRTTTG